MTREADVIVIGGGAAGLSAAREARRRGASVVLVERDRLGGDCTWVGCVPSKALIERARDVHAARRLGLEPDVDLPALLAEVRSVVHEIAHDEDEPTLRAEGIDVVEGQAAFVGPRRVEVDGVAIAGERIVIATGAAPLVPPIDGLADAQPLTNEDVFSLDALPRRLAVMGGGPIGIELAQAFARLGSHVTVLEGMDRIAGKEEPEASAVIQQVFESEGIDLVLGSMVEAVEGTADGSTLRTGDGRTVEADRILVAVGRKPATDGLQLDRAGVDVDDEGFIRVDDKLRTTADGVYAIGDIAGDLQFTHVGDEMGRIAVANALSRVALRRWSTDAVPWATFTDPEVGRVGMTEAQAHEAHGDDAQVACVPLDETDRGRASGHTAGFVKLVAGPRALLRNAAGGKLLGATVVAPGGADIVHEMAFAIRTHAFTGRLAQTVHTYPSWALAVRQAAAQFFGEQGGRTARPARP